MKKLRWPPSSKGARVLVAISLMSMTAMNVLPEPVPSGTTTLFCGRWRQAAGVPHLERGLHELELVGARREGIARHLALAHIPRHSCQTCRLSISYFLDYFGIFQSILVF